jgi:RNA polymerase sigma-70 factor, ECF subfamily
MSDVNPDSAETEALLRQAQAGDPRAFEQLLARHRPFLRGLVALRLDPKLRRRVDPSDVVQEAELEAFRRLTDYLERRPMPFRVWLRKTACERLLKLRAYHVGAAQRTVEREVPLPERSSLLLARRLLGGGSTPSQRFSRREAARLVNEALARLAEADREILLMREFEGLSYEEAGCALDVEPAAARKRYGRALLRLQKLLTDEGLLESPP